MTDLSRAHVDLSRAELAALWRMIAPAAAAGDDRMGAPAESWPREFLIRQIRIVLYERDLSRAPEEAITDGQWKQIMELYLRVPGTMKLTPVRELAGRDVESVMELTRGEADAVISGLARMADGA
jgi:hypothetical protein